MIALWFYYISSHLAIHECSCQSYSHAHFTGFVKPELCFLRKEVCSFLYLKLLAKYSFELPLRHKCSTLQRQHSWRRNPVWHSRFWTQLLTLHIFFFLFAWKADTRGTISKLLDRERGLQSPSSLPECLPQ